MNLVPYAHLRDGNDMEPMDERHVRMIHSILVSESPTSVANIGIANGYSSVATIEAISSGHVKVGYFVDIRLRDCFKQLLPNDRGGTVEGMPRFRLHEQNSQDFTGIAECWIIDGDHQSGAEIDFNKARASMARIIIAHDTAPDWAPGCQWGAIKIGQLMRETATTCFEDHKDRPGELTKRGLTIAFYYQPKEETLRNLQELNK